MITGTLCSSTSSWVLFLATAGLPVVSCVISSTLRPAIMPPRSLRIKGRALDLLLAAGGKWAGKDGEKSNLERLRRLRKCPPRWQHAERCSREEQSTARDHRFTVFDRHPRTPWDFLAGERVRQSNEGLSLPEVLSLPGINP